MVFVCLLSTPPFWSIYTLGFDIAVTATLDDRGYLYADWLVFNFIKAKPKKKKKPARVRKKTGKLCQERCRVVCEIRLEKMDAKARGISVVVVRWDVWYGIVWPHAVVSAAATTGAWWMYVVDTDAQDSALCWT